MAKEKVKAVSNEEIIAAILQHGTIKEAAAELNITPKTIYNRMEETDFKREYSEAKADILRRAVYSFNDRLTEAIETVSEIMNNKEIQPGTRLQAAQTIINSAGKFIEKLDAAEIYSRNMEAIEFEKGWI